MSCSGLSNGVAKWSLHSTHAPVFFFPLICYALSTCICKCPESHKLFLDLPMWHLVCSMHTSHWWLICLTLDSWMQKERRECSKAQKLTSQFLDCCRVSYWRARYGGYSGDLKPTSALDLLKKDGNVVLVDIRPQASLLPTVSACSCYSLILVILFSEDKLGTFKGQHVCFTLIILSQL